MIAIHPGGVDTFSHTWPFPRLWRFVVGLAISDIEHGAYNSVFAAAGKKVKEDKEQYTGAYLESKPTGRIATPSAAAQDTDLADRLWDTTNKYLASLGLSQ